MVRVHHHGPQIEFHAPVASLAFCFKLTVLLGTIFAPFLLAIASDGFWTTKEIHREQPRVLFTRDVMLLVEGAGAGDTFAYSTFPNYNTLVERNLVVPTIKWYESDTEQDGVNDKLHMTVEVPVSGATTINHFRVFLFFDYRIKDKLKINMKSMAVVDVTSPLSGASLVVDANLKFYQKTQLNRTGINTEYNSTDVPTESFPTSAAPYQAQTILSKYLDRDFTTGLDNVHAVWTSRRGAAKTFTADITIRYPMDTYYYNTDLTFTLKKAFVEYAVLYFFLIVLINPILKFVFTNQLLPVTVYNPFNDLAKKAR